ncbi:MAG: hypothetical protein OXC56_07365 [Chloroflexi bacterium]|nr:hypothetical protein [Chloroflexota bacterium]
MDTAERARWVAETVRQLRAHMRRMERRYGCTSEEMWSRWQDGGEPKDETGQEEVFDWIMNWRLLRDILANPRYEDLIPPDDPADDEAAAAAERAEQARLASQWRTASPDEELGALRANIQKMELRYKCTSEYMWNAVLAGTERETDEICLWLMDYYRLKQIDDAADSNGTGATPLSTSGAWTTSAVRES